MLLWDVLPTKCKQKCPLRPLPLIALPIVGLAGGAVVYDSMQARPAEQVRAHLGRMRAQVWESGFNAPLTQRPNGQDLGSTETAGSVTTPPLASLFPAGTRMIGLTDSYVEV